VLTCVELQLIDLRSHVEVTYHPTASITQAMSKMQEEIATASADYIDGILFSHTAGAIITARLTSSPSSSLPLRTFSAPWDPWFFLHARRLATLPTPTTERVPIQDYLFRYDRGAFWMGMHAFHHFRVPFTWLTRLLLDYFHHTRIMYHVLHTSGHTDRYIIHDVALPAPNAAHFADYIDRTFNIYPLWLCPVRKDGRASMGHPKPFAGDVAGKVRGAPYAGKYINVGVWGPYPSGEAEYVRANREIEAMASKLGGLKWLYSRVFYTEEEWWGIYDKEKYEALREKFHAGSLPSIWEKVRDRRPKRDLGTGWKGWVKGVVWKSELLRGCYGMWKAVRGGDYMLVKKEKTE
jgi:delta24-sterol reductase